MTTLHLHPNGDDDSDAAMDRELRRQLLLRERDDDAAARHLLELEGVDVQLRFPLGDQ